MDYKLSIKRKKYGVVITFISLLSTVLIFEYGRIEHWSFVLRILQLVSLIVLVLSITFTYVKTGLWNFTHKPIEKLDEREVALTSKSLRLSYSIFSVLVLILLMYFSIAERPLNIVLVVSLVLFAHLLPASVIIWLVKHTKKM